MANWTQIEIGEIWEKAEYIESINDIQAGEYVVHSIHGVGIYQGLTQQEIDGQLKDYLTINGCCGILRERKCPNIWSSPRY